VNLIPFTWIGKGEDKITFKDKDGTVWSEYRLKNQKHVQIPHGYEEIN
jgi:ribosomal protein L27